jgi:hypothetical protein
MHTEVEQKLAAYPAQVRDQLLRLRSLIYAVSEAESLGPVQESLKWGEPSYLTTGGSPVRMDWKPDSPDQVCLYFNCQTSLVETFAELFANELQFAGRRALVLPLTEALPVNELSTCLSMAMRYQQIKHLPMLGA